MAKNQPLRITEYDEAEKVTATYVQSDGEKGTCRIDTIVPPSASKSILQSAIDVFLPVGYPHSVTEDYLEYQIYDSLQAFSSSIASLLSSRAVLETVGVGDSTASPTAALLLSILQESIGRLATILFAHRFGTSLEPECKMYRLLADVLNDTGFVLDCLSPVFPKPIRVAVLSFSSVLRSLCGVAAGSSKASLSAHFAKQGNLGELNAKDSSQETVISLVGMLAGSFVIRWVETPFATWTLLILLLSIHLETNRRAVRAVKMHTLNRQRATLVYHHLRKGHVPTPDEIASEEHIFERDGVLRGPQGSILGHCLVGAPFSRLLSAIAESKTTTNASRVADQRLEQVLSVYEKHTYLLWCDRASVPGKSSLYIVLKKGVDSKDLTMAWWQVLAFAEEVKATPSGIAAKGNDEISILVELFKRSLGVAEDLWQKNETQLRGKGWDLSNSALETTAGGRIAIEES